MLTCSTKEKQDCDPVCPEEDKHKECPKWLED